MPVMRAFLVVGASSSVGGAVVTRLSRDGDRVLATYHQNKRVAEAENVVAVRLDLTDEAELKAFGPSVMSHFGDLDAAIFLAGILPGHGLAEYDHGDIDRVMAVNFSGQAKLIRCLLPHFKPGSHVLMISSISAQRGSYDPIYAASKGAVLSLVKSLASWLAPKIRVNAIAPALIEDTTMFHDMAPEQREHHLSETPMRRLLRPHDLAEVIYDLCQDHWSHLNGACIDLNGGEYVR